MRAQSSACNHNKPFGGRITLTGRRPVPYRKGILPSPRCFLSIKPVGDDLNYAGEVYPQKLPCAPTPGRYRVGGGGSLCGHSVGLFRYAAVTVRNREGAQDAVQEVFLRYFIARSQGQKIQNRRAWLYRVLRNYLLDSLKSSSFKKEDRHGGGAPGTWMGQDPELSYHHRELERRVNRPAGPARAGMLAAAQRRLRL